MLSDGIQIQVLATFNCPLKSLDSALLRPGRLVVEYCFPETLSVEHARSLAESIGVSNSEQINEPIPLANVYAMRDEKLEEKHDEAISSECHKCSPWHLYGMGGEEE